MSAQNDSASKRAGPLAGVRIVAFTQFLLGPAAAQYLGDLGADVIKVERPGVGAWERGWAGADSFINGESTFFLMTHRGSRSVALDLSTSEGAQAARELVSTADVLIENFRPGVMDRLGLSYESFVKENPALIYISASGFGEGDELRDLPGQDLLLQAMSGMMSITGASDQLPTPVGAPVIDQHGASLLAMSACAALYQRTSTGRGQLIRVSMLEAALDLQMEPVVYWLNGSTLERPPVPLGSTFHPAPYGTYAVSDGHIVLSLSPWKKVYDALAEVLQRPLLADVETSGGESLWAKEKVYVEIAALLAEMSSAVAISTLSARSIWVSPVLDYEALFATPGVDDLGLVMEIEHPVAGTVRLLRHPVRYSEGLPYSQSAPPSVGEHTAEIMGQVEKLRSGGLIND